MRIQKRQICEKTKQVIQEPLISQNEILPRVLLRHTWAQQHSDLRSSLAGEKTEKDKIEPAVEKVVEMVKEILIVMEKNAMVYQKLRPSTGKSSWHTYCMCLVQSKSLCAIFDRSHGVRKEAAASVVACNFATTDKYC